LPKKHTIFLKKTKTYYFWPALPPPPPDAHVSGLVREAGP
jgi:hypothetical protein